MKTIGFSVKRLACVEPEANGTFIYLEARMTEEQMFHAVQMFQAQITEETWARWLERIAEEAS